MEKERIFIENLDDILYKPRNEGESIRVGKRPKLCYNDSCTFWKKEAFQGVCEKAECGMMRDRLMAE